MTYIGHTLYNAEFEMPRTIQMTSGRLVRSVFFHKDFTEHYIQQIELYEQTGNSSLDIE